MASFNAQSFCGASVVELADEPFQTLKLRLTNRAAALGSSRPQVKEGYMSHWSNKFHNLFTKAKDEANLEQVSTPEALERNKEKIRQIFEKMTAQLQEQREEVLNDMNTLTPQQQEDVITFWTSASAFFTDIMNWLQNVFTNIVEKIRQGFHVVKKQVEELFATVKEWLSQIF